MQPRDAVTSEDIYKLVQIKRQMTKQYHQYNILAWKEEYDYNRVRSERYIDYKKQAKEKDQKYTETELEKSAKFYAENRHWKRREYNKTARSMLATIEAIKDYIVTYHTLAKGEMDALHTLDDG